ncbi:hypothetical protein Dimus_006918 [Dionaea muscipula]
MDQRVGLLFLLMLAVNWACDARDLPSSDLSGFRKTSRKLDVCTLCEEYTTVALTYLSENKTQTEVIEKLHEACSQLHSFTQQCVTVVDFYAPLFFSELSAVDADDFCKKVNLCGQTKIASLLVKVNDDKCDLCHHAIDEVKTKLKDPDAKLEIIEMLLKGCDAVEGNYAKKCKAMVFEYGPLILSNAEKFLDDKDICVDLHACSSSTAGTSSEDLADGKIMMPGGATAVLRFNRHALRRERLTLVARCRSRPLLFRILRSEIDNVIALLGILLAWFRFLSPSFAIKTMHPPLTLHRHPMCAEIIEQFQKCHSDHPIAKFFGQCTDLKIKLDRCFRQEKALKRKANFEESKKLKERLQAYRKGTAESIGHP